MPPPATNPQQTPQTNGFSSLRANWAIIMGLVLILGTTAGAWYDTQLKIALFGERQLRIEKQVADLPTTYIPREVIDARLLGLRIDEGGQFVCGQACPDLYATILTATREV